MNSRRKITSADSIRGLIIEKVQKLLRDKEQDFGKDLMDYLLKVIMLQAIDSNWKDHLLSMDHLKEGIGLRGYGQKDPVREYQREGYEMFMEMISRIKMDTLEKAMFSANTAGRRSRRISGQKQKQDYILSRGEDVPAAQTVKRERVRSVGMNLVPVAAGKNIKNAVVLRDVKAISRGAGIMVTEKMKINVPGFLANGISAGIKLATKRPGFNLFHYAGKGGCRIYKEHI